MAKRYKTSVLSVYDSNGNKIGVPAIKGKSAYEYAKDGGYTGTEAEFAAMQAGDVLPDYWESYLPEKIAEIKALQDEGGKDCFSFPLLADIHIRQNLGKHSGVLARRILDECYMRFALCVGDVVNRGTGSETNMDEDFDSAEKLLKPIRDKLLQTQGNHDGSWGFKDYNGDGTMDYYAYNFTPQKLHSLIYRKVGLVGDCHFDTSGTGYWIDDVSNKVRYIILNTHNNPYEEDADGFAVYNNMTEYKLRQSQFDLVVEACSTIPSDEWSVLSASHIPLNYNSLENLALMAKVLNAYKTKTTFSGSYAGEYDYDAISVSVDFTSAKGEYVAHFAGHTHLDSVAVYNGISMFTTRCDGNNEPSDSGLTKVEGTVTEQSFDVFTVNRKEKKIYVTKIGAGNNRYWDYANGVAFDPDVIEPEEPDEPTNIIDTVGYKDDTRISSSDGVTEKALAGYVTTGMITLPANSTLKTSGANYTTATYSSAMIYRYNPDTEAFMTAYSTAQTGISGIAFALDSSGNLTITTTIDLKLRLVGYGSGANLVVTIE